ncbi:uncharacterized protein DUF4386 [Kribbella sp. VKM Ac-2571]|uniref:DUF4386 domain-containing protein n=1 Tax=Kribbella sp. VKM Ac-2571 TaxID=2512222 RepID=UPI00105F2719|nr:DUF4386 domain-containing protein [Kribbella sp. VKM Ac-2571]TDO58928.1 uncharacterized protein DUF4386 [Kribbella sp. VKM Ac-2571]
MTITASTASAPTATARSVDPTRSHVRAAGIFYLVTFAASFPALFLIGPVLHDHNYILGAGQDTRVLWGCLLDFVNALAGIGSAVALFPVMKRYKESLALGFVTSRMLEAAVIMIGVVSLVTVVTLRQDLAGSADPNALAVVGRALVEVRNWTFLFGAGTMPAISAILLGTLMYRSRRIPRFMPIMGLVGAPLLLTANVLTVLGHNAQLSVLSGIATAPVALWELSIGIYMTFKGFKPVS